MLHCDQRRSAALCAGHNDRQPAGHKTRLIFRKAAHEANLFPPQLALSQMSASPYTGLKPVV